MGRNVSRGSIQGRRVRKPFWRHSLCELPCTLNLSNWGPWQVQGSRVGAFWAETLGARQLKKGVSPKWLSYTTNLYRILNIPPRLLLDLEARGGVFLTRLPYTESSISPPSFSKSDLPRTILRCKAAQKGEPAPRSRCPSNRCFLSCLTP